MAELNDCLLPDDLYYHVEYNVWLRDSGDGIFELGMTDIAQTMSGSVIHCRPKKTGKAIKEGKSLATVESGKWVGPVRSPFACEIVERNDAVEADAAVLNRSPYKDGWIVKVKPADPAAIGSLLRGDDAVNRFREYMSEHDVANCIHCEGFDD